MCHSAQYFHECFQEDPRRYLLQGLSVLQSTSYMWLIWIFLLYVCGHNTLPQWLNWIWLSKEFHYNDLCSLFLLLQLMENQQVDQSTTDLLLLSISTWHCTGHKYSYIILLWHFINGRHWKPPPGGCTLHLDITTQGYWHLFVCLFFKMFWYAF